MIPAAAKLVIGGALAIGLLLGGLRACDEHADAKRAEWRADANAKAAVRIAAKARADSANYAHLKVDTTYLRGRDILLNPRPGSPPVTAEVRACFALSDRLRSSCEIRHDADTAALHATERELETWKHKPDPANPRLTFYGEGLYDIIGARPVFRAGVQFRVPFLNSISLSAAGDLAIPPAGESKVTTRGLVGIRYNFR